MTHLFLKTIVLTSFLLFFDYLLMIIIGCTSCALGVADNFYECTFCNIGKFVLLISFVLLIAALYPDIKSLIKKHE